MPLSTQEQNPPSIEALDPSVVREPFEALGVLAQAGVAVIDTDLGITADVLDTVERYIISTGKVYPPMSDAFGEHGSGVHKKVQSIRDTLAAHTMHSAPQPDRPYLSNLYVKCDPEVRRMELAVTNWHQDAENFAHGIRLVTPLKPSEASLEVVANNNMMTVEDGFPVPSETAEIYSIPYEINQGILLPIGRKDGMPVTLENGVNISVEHPMHSGNRSAAQKTFLLVVDFVLAKGASFGPLPVEQSAVRAHNSRSDVIEVSI